MRPYNSLVHPRSWRAFMEYGNGIVGDMCVHMLDMVRWMLDLGWPTRIASTGGILVDKKSKANITDTQTATFDFGDLPVVWTHRTYGDAPDPKYPWGATFYGDKGTLKAERHGLRLHPVGQRRADPRGRRLRARASIPEDKTEKDLETARRAGHPRPHEGLPRGDRSRAASRSRTSSRATSRRRACILANMSHEARPLAARGTTPRARSSATTRRTSCSAAPIAARGSIRRPARSDDRSDAAVVALSRADRRVLHRRHQHDDGVPAGGLDPGRRVAQNVALTEVIEDRLEGAGD